MKVLETNNLGMKYGEKYAIKDFNLEVKQGEIYGLVGKNGAGKTTFMKIILGLLPKYEGSFKLLESNDNEKSRRSMGALIETPAFFEYMTGFQNLLYYSKAYRMGSKEEILKLLDLVRLGDARDKKYKTYSLGMKQRLGIALALIGDPNVLVLDEPINGIDPEGIFEIRNLLRSLVREKGKTIIISSHILSEIEQLCDKICMIDKGYVIDVIDAKNNNSEYKFHTILRSNNEEKLKEIANKFKIDFSNGEINTSKDFDLNELLKDVVNNDLKIVDLQRRKDSLEEYYLDKLERNK